MRPFSKSKWTPALFFIILLASLITRRLKKEDPTPYDMVQVPAGEFVMGTNETSHEINLASIFPNKPLLTDERPAHTIYLDSFYIDRDKVRNRAYQKYAKATGRPLPLKVDKTTADRPVTHLTWQEASDYCRSLGKRLPTEEEWEKAARGTDGRIYPWGNQFDPELEKAVQAALPPKPILSPYGTEAMVGHGWEWTADRYRPYPNNPYRAEAFWKNFRVIRGGAAGDQPGALRLLTRTTTRFYADPDKGDPIIGFRCAKSAE
ncbi:MAG: SUMF1/EgtB/PvdO family nonheme iron enzyme [Nitrospirae bacterium]|nr:SUMF1/EgtB/PvdO family nonheme iron enzyme [Candidatus Manganitrophaceae bacterium]